MLLRIANYYQILVFLQLLVLLLLLLLAKHKSAINTDDEDELLPVRAGEGRNKSKDEHVCVRAI